MEVKNINRIIGKTYNNDIISMCDWHGYYPVIDENNIIIGIIQLDIPMYFYSDGGCVAYLTKDGFYDVDPDIWAGILPNFRDDHFYSFSKEKEAYLTY